LRAFDAAARHMSFAKAASELNVTPAALSFQIKSLEEHLGAPVFRRMNRAVELTEAGQAMANGAADGFQTLAAAWRAAQRTLDSGVLTVTAGPAFTAKWLAPRLYDFAQAHPEIDLRFAATMKRVDLNREGVDVAIRFGPSALYPGIHSTQLAREWACPVMSVEMAQKYPTSDSLQNVPLIHDDSTAFLNPPIDWKCWFKAMGIERETSHGLQFSNADHAIDAALAGAGMALGRRSLVVKDIAEGRLVTPTPLAIDTQAGFWFLCAEGAQTRQDIVTFRQWVIAEIEKNTHVTDAMTIVAPETDPAEVNARLAARRVG